MRFVIQVISSHAVFSNFVLDALVQDPSLRRQISVRNSSKNAVKPSEKPLFLLDLCCPGPQPGPLCQLLRRKHPSSKFVCLIAPDQGGARLMDPGLLPAVSEVITGSW